MSKPTESLIQEPPVEAGALVEDPATGEPREVTEEGALYEGPRTLWVRLAQVGVAVGTIGSWELLVLVGFLDPFFFSQPSEILERMLEWFTSGYVYEHLLVTLQEALIGLFLGAFLGIIVGFALARIEILAAIFDPYINALNAVPRVLLAPIFLLWFGLGMASKIALVVSLVFFLVFFNVYRGVREVDTVVLNNVRMLGATESQLMRHVILPSAVVWILSSLRTSVGFAIMGAVVGEYLGASKGIGFIIAQFKGMFDTTGVFAGMGVLVVFVALLDRAVSKVERGLLRWKPAR